MLRQVAPGLLFQILPIILVLILSFGRDRYTFTKDIFKNQLWHCSELLLLLTTLLVYQFVVLTIYRYSRHVTIAYTVGFSAIAFILIFCLLRYRYGQRIEALGYSRENLPSNVIFGLKVFFLYEAARLAAFLVSGTENRLFDYSRTDLEKYSGVELSAFVILTVLLVPLIEEGVFRGFMFSPLARKTGKKAGFLLTGYIWASFHGHRELVPLVILGLLLAYVFEKTGSLVAGISIHILVNLFAVGMYCYTMALESYIHFLDRKMFLILVTVLFLLCFIIIIIRDANEKREKPDVYEKLNNS